MQTKKCKRCGFKKTLDNFHNKKSSKDGLHSWCKTCAIKNAKQHYRKNDKKDILISYSKRLIAELLETVDKVKSKYGCFNCGENEACCLDFHHINPEDKIRNVSDWIRRKSKKRIIEEINKCIIVCSNCHRRLHYGKISVNNAIACNETLSIFN